MTMRVLHIFKNMAERKCVLHVHYYFFLNILEEIEGEAAAHCLHVSTSCPHGIARKNWGCKVTEGGDCKKYS